ncbi:uncharacterized protein KQ657_001983 [Scheffersomyces spartinae]|uniref:TECPR1-like DysF domain-containing protein n=1 Tax=Scheffersomyces spartinae TaxID=45513 RepID=A0A9P8AGE7_9ASCO|nr:uncharacterized protein KQ657_001983 [Scheffersomyces spartinae]KAG7192265.1 hypothetical protein KQ657_001983 [Scheffersomyces spartinae]
MAPHDTLPEAEGHNTGQLSEDTILHIGLMAESALVAAKSQRRNSSHFSDRIVDSIFGGSRRNSGTGSRSGSVSGSRRLGLSSKSSTTSTITNSTMTKKQQQQDNHDDHDDKEPGFSIWIIANNFKELSKRLTPLLSLQKGAINVLTWKSPSQTVSVLVFYTMVCKWPHLVLALPMLIVLVQGILPGYLYRHPIRTPHIITVKKRGKSLIEYFNSSNDDSILIEYLDQTTTDTSLILSTVAESATIEIPEDAIDEVIDTIDKGEQFVNTQANLLSNMKHLQNGMTDVVRTLKVVEKLGYDLTGFANEKLSTAVFYGLLVVTFVIIVMGVYIPWQLIFIQTGWVLVILCHPNSKKYLAMMLKNNKKSTLKIKRKKRTKSESVISEENNLIKTFDTKGIFPLDSPQTRTLEVFELQYRSSTQPKWKNTVYCSSVFDLDDPKRSRGLPRGASEIWDVIPPKDWKFDFAYVNSWEIDTAPQDLIEERALSRTLMIKNDANDGWMYDKVKVLEADFEYRRRRLTRSCYRYARSVWKPQH